MWNGSMRYDNPNLHANLHKSKHPQTTKSFENGDDPQTPGNTTFIWVEFFGNSLELVIFQ